MLKQARLNPTANGLVGLKKRQKALRVQSSLAPNSSTPDLEGVNGWFGCGSKHEEEGATTVVSSSSSSTSASSSTSSRVSNENNEGCHSEPESSGFSLLRPPPIPKLKRRLAKPRPDEIILVDDVDDDVEECVGTRNGEGCGTATKVSEVLRLQAVGVGIPFFSVVVMLSCLNVALIDAFFLANFS